MLKTKYIFIIGGVLSGVGKGITSASIGRMFKNRGYNVSAVKIDPYINVDAGTMNPIEHGEVFVTEDGDETDQDIGNYERFLGTDIYSINYMTTGRVYQSVIEKERAMFYKGKCVEVVPHIPLEVIDRIKKAAEKAKADIMLIEIGGTVGEYQNILFLEAARMLRQKQPNDVAYLLVSYMPVPRHLGEMKTKPTQYASRTLNSSGLQADFIIARGEDSLDKPRKEKIAMMCGLYSEEEVISAPDVDSVYDIPAIFEKQNLATLLAKKLKLKLKPQIHKEWEQFAKKTKNTDRVLNVAVIGKYFGTGNYTLSDSYISVIEAIKHAGWHSGASIKMNWLDAEEYEKKPKAVEELKKFDAVIVPGGFGTRGVEGVIRAIQYARENKIPYLGLCYGMQLATIEFARHVLGFKDANTVEINPKSSNLIVHINESQKMNVNSNRYGGTMRLGAYDCELKEGSLVAKLYGEKKISERHRHRYEFNNYFRAALQDGGMDIVGVNKQADLVEIVELKDHPFFVGVQFHPEFKSRPLDPHPLFVGLVRAGIKRKSK